MRSLPAALRTKLLRQLGRSRKPSVASKWIPQDAVIMLTGFLLSYQGLGEPFYWPLRQSKTKHAEIENWMLMDGNPIMLWFNFSSGKYNCFCNPAASLTEAQEKTQREERQRWGGGGEGIKIGRIFQILLINWSWYVFKGQQPVGAGQ